MKDPSKIKVLVACEESQRVCMAFRERGFKAYSCDIQEPSGGHPEWNIFGDSYRYREKYNEYRAMRNAQAKAEKDGQIHINTEDAE